MTDEEWEFEQALPEHKRQGWAERMYEQADELRDRMREEAALKWAYETGAMKNETD